jgi:hypothetical protein
MHGVLGLASSVARAILLTCSKAVALLCAVQAFMLVLGRTGRQAVLPVSRLTSPIGSCTVEATRRPL